MKFSKIKWSAKEKSVTLTWAEQKPAGDTIEHTLTSPDTPRPEFLAALRGLQPFASSICECEEWGQSLRPIGVTLTTGKDGNRGAVITCLRNVSIVAAPLVLNTPHVTEDSWPRGLFGALDYLETEAELYVHGNRAQTTLFPTTKDEKSTVTISVGDRSVTMTGDEFSHAAARV